MGIGTTYRARLPILPTKMVHNLAASDRAEPSTKGPTRLIPLKSANVGRYGAKDVLANINPFFSWDTRTAAPVENQATVNACQPTPSGIIVLLQTVQEAGRCRTRRDVNVGFYHGDATMLRGVRGGATAPWSYLGRRCPLRTPV